MSLRRVVARIATSTTRAGLIASLALALPAVTVLAQPPFGGDDLGTLPADAPGGTITECKGVARASPNSGLNSCTELDDLSNSSNFGQHFTSVHGFHAKNSYGLGKGFSRRPGGRSRT